METVLVIDDEEPVRQLIRRFLERAGFSVVEAHDGQEGLRALRETTPEIVITDIFMPGREGLETIREMRRERPELRIIAISGGSARLQDFSPLPIARSLGAVEVLEKPFTSAELLATVERARRT